MTTLTNHYGSDAQANRFSDPATNEAYFTLVDKTTGDIKIYNEEFGVDKVVGTLPKNGTQVEFNKNWWGGANGNDRNFVNNNLPQIRNQATKTVIKGLKSDTPGISYNSANKQASDLLGKNTGKPVGTPSFGEMQSGVKQMGEDSTNTRNSFPGAGGSTPLVFPEAIRTTEQDILQFNMMKYRPKSLNQSEKQFGFVKDRPAGDIIGSAILPIPSGIRDDQQVQWGGDSMDALQIELARIALAGIEDLGAGVDAATEAAQRVATNAGETGTALANALAGMASGSNNLLTRTTGQVLNPNMELLFGGPNLRNFGFSFFLSPRSKEEAKTVIKMIRFFKQGMAPIRTKSNLFLKSPHTFQLAYKLRGGRGRGEKTHPYLNKFKECALQGFGVQYTPTGNYSTFSDGVMMQYQINMAFSELEPIYNDDYGNGTFPAEIGF